MNRIKQFQSLVLRVFYTFRLVGIFSRNDPGAEYIIWAPDFFSIRFFYGDNLQKVLFTYSSLSSSGKSVTVWTRNDIGRFHGKNIIFFGGMVYNKFGFRNYMDSLVSITKNLEAQLNNVFPNSTEVMLWENKAYMHQKFHELGVKTPDTVVFPTVDEVLSTDGLKYPVLIKEEHSCSSVGVHKILSKSELSNLLDSPNFRLKNKNVIVQKLLNIRRDLRVIFVNEEIVLHYWRINLSSEWKPTSTGHGSRVDFDSFPEEWREFILSTFKKLKIRTGAFDLAWDCDDMSNEPYVLEVSTFYQPNPIPLEQYDLENYGDWKKSVRISNSYQKAVVNVIRTIQEKFVSTILE